MRNLDILTGTRMEKVSCIGRQLDENLRGVRGFTLQAQKNSRRGGLEMWKLKWQEVARVGLQHLL